MTRRFPFVLLAALIAIASPPAVADQPIVELGRDLAPFLECINGTAERFSIAASVRIDGHDVDVRIRRDGAETFTARFDHAEYGFTLDRSAHQTRLIIPAHRRIIVAQGALVGNERLAPKGLAARIVSNESMAATVWSALTNTPDPNAAAAALIALLRLDRAGDQRWTPRDDADTIIAFNFAGQVRKLSFKSNDAAVEVSRLADDAPVPGIDTTGYERQLVDRLEMERLIVRAMRRASEVLAPGPTLRNPPRADRDVPHGKLRWVDGHRLVLLAGTPEQIGKAHGQLLGREAIKCMDSTLYTIGLVDTIRTGKWFPDQLRAAHERLAPHIPKRHLAETDALADAIGVSHEKARLTNVFPELFHCSGFAVWGSATRGGVLYHGRVLDYMTHIGLQDAATTFIIAPEGYTPFVTVGYAGFIGSVTGMNAKQVSLGEMGGRGEGQWDGVPMATLMRRALEECDTLDEVKKLWSESPRTCEYYYVFADGKIPSAVGVAATPDKIEFIGPGQSHDLLGEGIADAVVLSAGDRLAALRRRVIDGHGSIDEAAAVRLMDRPVAMGSNLHNALMVPQKLRILIANATHDTPAAEQPYITIDLRAWFNRMPTGE